MNIYDDPEFGHVKNEIYNRILKGEHVDDIREDLMQQYGFKENTLIAYCTEVYNMFNESIENERENIIATHINRYDNHYASAIALAGDNDPNIGVRERQNYYRFMNEALDALESKEGMLNMKSKRFNIFVKEQTNNILINKKRGMSLLDFNLELLTFTEKMELLEILGKAEIKQTDTKLVDYSVDDEITERKIYELQSYEDQEVEDVVLDEEMNFNEEQTTEKVEVEEETAHDDWDVARSIQKSYNEEIKKLDKKLEEERKANKKFEQGE